MPFPGSRCTPSLPLHFLPWPQNLAGRGGDLESPASLLLGGAGPVWPQWAFLFLAFPSPPPKTSDVKGIGNQEQAPGQGRAAPRSLAGLGDAAHLPVTDSWRFVPSAFSALSLLWRLAFPRKPTSPTVPPPKSFVCCFHCPQRTGSFRLLSPCWASALSCFKIVFPGHRFVVSLVWS